jgi:hypothetical protein
LARLHPFGNVASNKLKQLIDSLPPEEQVKRKIARFLGFFNRFYVFKETGVPYDPCRIHG